MDQLTREDMQVRSDIFDRFALKDQKRYYQEAIKTNRKATSQVNFYRAFFAFLTGFCAAVAGLIIQVSFLGSGACEAAVTAPASHCDEVRFVVGILTLMAVVLPAIGGAFSTLADLYQWDKLNTVYETAAYNLEEADALSPLEEMDDLTYRASMRAFAEGTLTVMSDETAQWGQSIRTPSQIDEFLEDERRKLRDQSGTYSSDKDSDNYAT